jgi:hypothetical protein
MANSKSEEIFYCFSGTLISDEKLNTKWNVRAAD